MTAARTSPADRASGWMITATRIAVGLLWLRNAGWKTPTGFGGLRGYVNLGIEHPVFPPFSWGLEHLVLPNMTPFGFMTLLLEVSLAVTLLLGWKTRLFALLGAAQSLMIGLSVANAPNEWQWAYVLMVGIHLLLFATDAGRFGGLDGSLARGQWRVPAWILGASAVVVGLWSSLDAGDSGSILKVSKEIHLFRSTVSGGLVFAAIGVAALVLAGIGQRKLLVIPAAASGVLVLATLALWRDDGSFPLSLGYNGTSMAALGTMGLGLGLLALAPSVRRGSRG